MAAQAGGRGDRFDANDVERSDPVEGDVGIWSTVRHRGVVAFGRDVLVRFRDADGTSHTRALAYQTMFIILSGFVGLIGLATALDVQQLRGVVLELGRSLLPGQSGRLLQEAVKQGAKGGGTTALVGLGAAFVAGTFAMAQLERSANRASGSKRDRPGVRRYVAAAALSASVGLLFLVAALVLAGGRALATGFGWTGEAATAWTIARWPIGAAVVSAAIFLSYRLVPRQRLASGRLLAAGTAIAVTLWVAFTIGLAAYFALRADAGPQPYGPLLAVIALLLWSMLTALGLHIGLAAVGELSGWPRLSDDVVRVPEAERLTDPAVPATRD